MSTPVFDVAEYGHEAHATQAALVARLCEHATQWFGERMEALLEDFDNTLFEQAVNAASSAGQNHCFEAMNLLRAEREEFLAICRAELARRIPLALAAGGVVRHATHSVATTDESQVLEPMIGRVLGLHEATLKGLNALLNSLLGTERFRGAEGSPGGPEILAACCVAALHGVGLDAAARSIALERLEHEVLAGIDELCTLSAGLLLDAGIASAPPGSPAEECAARTERVLRERIPARNRAEQTRTLVGLLFDELLGNPDIAPLARAQLAALRAPVTEAALAEEDFFCARTHPLRRLVAELSELLPGWEPAQPAQCDALARVLAHTVARLGADAEVQAAACAEFSAFAADELQRARLAQRRTEETEQARALQCSAREAIESAFAQHLGAGRLPAAAEELLGEGWRRVMTLAYLRGGASGADWQEALGTLARFAALWRGGANGLPDALGEELREQLMQGGFDPLRTEILLQGISDDLATWEPPAPLPVALVQVSEGAAGGGADSDPALAGLLGEIDALARGTWVRFLTRSARGQLALRLADPERLLFVDRHGVKLDCLAREEFAALLACGGARILPRGDLFDLALAAVLARLEPQPKRKCSGVNA